MEFSSTLLPSLSGTVTKDCWQGGCYTSQSMRTANLSCILVYFRTYVAALHFNSNADRKIRQADNGDDKYVLKFSRGRKQWTIVPVKEDTKFGM